jgi:transcription elongation factor Elf1
MSKLNELLIALAEARARDCGQNAALEAFNQECKAEAERTKQRLSDIALGKNHFTVYELSFSAYAVCKCGAGLAYPDGIGMHGAWYCSAYLLGNDAKPAIKHEIFPFAFYEIKSESQPSAEGWTTRPPGTHVEIEPHYVCLTCKHSGKWPQVRPNKQGRAYQETLSCEKCGERHSNNDGSLSMKIDTRWHDKVVDDAPIADQGGAL